MFIISKIQAISPNLRGKRRYSGFGLLDVQSPYPAINMPGNQAGLAGAPIPKAASHVTFCFVFYNLRAPAFFALKFCQHRSHFLKKLRRFL